jgi:hypothetical protein
MLAMAKEYPALLRTVNQQLTEFIKSENFRTKENLPSLGDFLPMLSISDKVSWQQFAMAYLSETFDRNVLWYVSSLLPNGV